MQLVFPSRSPRNQTQDLVMPQHMRNLSRDVLLSIWKYLSPNLFTTEFLRGKLIPEISLPLHMPCSLASYARLQNQQLYTFTKENAPDFMQHNLPSLAPFIIIWTSERHMLDTSSISHEDVVEWTNSICNICLITLFTTPPSNIRNQSHRLQETTYPPNYNNWWKAQAKLPKLTTRFKILSIHCQLVVKYLIRGLPVKLIISLSASSLFFHSICFRSFSFIMSPSVYSSSP